MHVLITGGFGFIGLHTARALLDAGHDVVSTQFRVRRDPPFIASDIGRRLTREIVDVTSPYALDEVFRRHPIDAIVHLAVTGVEAAAPPASEEYRATMGGLLNVLHAAATHGVKRTIVASSISAYTGLPAGPFGEDQPLPVTSVNATTAFKKAEEILALHYGDRTGADIVCARIAFTYGPLYHSTRNIIARMLRAAVKSAAVPDDIHADEWFDFLYVRDCAAALVALLSAPQLGTKLYNVGSGTATQHTAVAAAVRELVPGFTIALRPGRRSPHMDATNFMRSELLTRDTGFRPQYDIRSSVADYAEWLRGNEN